MRWQDSTISSVFHFTPYFEWMDGRRLVILRATGEEPSPTPNPSYVVTVVDAADGSTRDVPARPGRGGLTHLERVPTWPQPVMVGNLWNPKTRDYTECVEAVNAEGTALEPAQWTAGDFLLTGNYFRDARLSYRGKELTRQRWAEIAMGPATVSPDRRFAAWAGRQGSKEAPTFYLECFDSRSGKTYHAPKRLAAPVTIWFTDEDLRPAVAARPPVGWKAFQETRFKGF